MVAVGRAGLRTRPLLLALEGQPDAVAGGLPAGVPGPGTLDRNARPAADSRGTRRGPLKRGHDRRRRERPLVLFPGSSYTSLGGSIMKSRSNQISRRTFLTGVGVTMGLPWLESLAAWE